MSKRVNGKKGNKVRKFKSGDASHCTKVRGSRSGKNFSAEASNLAASKEAEEKLL